MEALFFRWLNIWIKLFFGNDRVLRKILSADGAPDENVCRPPGGADETAVSAQKGDAPALPADLSVVLENRMAALEARVLALERTTVNASDASKHLKEFSDTVTETHLRFRADLISLIHDHIDVLKFVHDTATPCDGHTNKLVRTYIRRAEGQLDQFQKRFAQLEAAGERIRNGARLDA